MGFLKKIFSAVAKVVTAPQKIIATGIKKVGELMGASLSTPVYKVGWFLENVGDFLTPYCYKESTTSTKETFDFGAECKKLYEQTCVDLRSQINKIVDAKKHAIDECKIQFQSFVPDDVYQRIKTCINYDLFEKYEKDSLTEIAQKISLDCTEFLQLVSIESNTERNEKCQKYIRIILDNVCSKTETRINEHTKSIIFNMLNIVEEHIVYQKAVLAEKQAEYNKLLAEKDNPEFILHRISEKVVDIAYLSSVSALINES